MTRRPAPYEPNRSLCSEMTGVKLNWLAVRQLRDAAIARRPAHLLKRRQIINAGGHRDSAQVRIQTTQVWQEVTRWKRRVVQHLCTCNKLWQSGIIERHRPYQYHPPYSAAKRCQGQRQRSEITRLPVAGDNNGVGSEGRDTFTEGLLHYSRAASRRCD